MRPWLPPSRTSGDHTTIVAPLNYRKVAEQLNWVIIALILLAAFGPIFWLVPSRTDRRLAKMRARARVHGMQVEVTQLADLYAPLTARVTAGGRRREPTVQCAAYRLGLRDLAKAAPRWNILRSPDPNGGPVEGWQWESVPDGDAEYWQRVAEVMRTLPADALACAADASQVACWWRERATGENALASVDALHESLTKLGEIQRAADAHSTPDDVVGDGPAAT
jgi:hypothetical protein